MSRPQIHRKQNNNRRPTQNNFRGARPGSPIRRMEHKKTQHPNTGLRLIPLGGLSEFGRNMMLLEYKDKILIIDAGLRMPGEDMPGIDYIIPNTAYLKDKKKNILGTVITHGHLDHIGAIPYCWNRLGNPRIFAPKLAKGMILKRQTDFARQPKLDIEEVQNNSIVKLGVFEIEYFKQNHNIPDNYGLLIKTPVGNIVHTSDFKFDKTPMHDLPTDFKNLKRIGRQNILFLMSDSTGAENEGHSLSEKTIFKNLEKIFQESNGRIISSTFASHLNRVQQLIALAEKYNRKVALEGYSMKNNVEIARNLKYINIKKGTIIKPDEISKLPDNQVSFICTGGQGEQGAVFMRIASDDYRFLKLKKGDSVIFSSSVIPGNERSVQCLKDQFYRAGAKVYHYQMMDIHASGHAYQNELIEMIKIMKPKLFTPLHGQYSMLTRHAELAEKAGVKKHNIKVLENGDILNISETRANIERGRIISNHVMVDGLGIGDVGEVVLRDRQTLAQDGMFVIIVTINQQTGRVRGSPDIISRGFVYLRESKELLNETRKKVVKIVEETAGKGKGINHTLVKEEIRNKVSGFLFSKTKRRPMVLTVLIAV